jgi:hypothetical protein
MKQRKTKSSEGAFTPAQRLDQRAGTSAIVWLKKPRSLVPGSMAPGARIKVLGVSSVYPELVAEYVDQ